MTILACTNWRQQFGDYELNITARYIDPIAVEIHTMLIVRTVKLYLYIAKAIQEGKRELSPEMKERSVEISIEDELQKTKSPYTFENYPETRLTIFDWNHVLDLTIHSSTLPQQALDLWWAMHDAKSELAPLYSQNGIKTPQNAPNSSADEKSAITPQQPANGVVRATRAPNPNAPQYADGQLVEFTIKRVVLGVHPTSGSVIYSLWGDLGRKFALKTIYRTSAHSDEDSYDYAAIAPLLESLQLAIPGNVQAEGKWRLIMRAAHDKGKEYMNVQSMEALS